MRAISFEYDDRLGLVAFLSFDMYTLVARSWVVWQSVGVRSKHMRTVSSVVGL